MKTIKEVKISLLVYEAEQGDGYAFPCDKDGHIL